MKRSKAKATLNSEYNNKKKNSFRLFKFGNTFAGFAQNLTSLLYFIFTTKKI